MNRAQLYLDDRAPVVAVSTVLCDLACAELMSTVQDAVTVTQPSSKPRSHSPTTRNGSRSSPEGLAASEHDDPEFGAALRAEWASHSSGNVYNQVQGSVARLVQARDIHSNITL
jgi:hypothetical protein